METKKAFKTLKQVSGIVVTVGVAAIVGNAVKFTTPATIGKITKVCVGIGSVVLGGLASDACVKYTEKAIDEAAGIAKDFAESIDVEVEEAEPEVTEA